jgi:hypothetical protein
MVGVLGFLKAVLDGGMLSQIPRALTRYSANAQEFPVNVPPLFAGISGLRPS